MYHRWPRSRQINDVRIALRYIRKWIRKYVSDRLKPARKPATLRKAKQPRRTEKETVQFGEVECPQSEPASNNKESSGSRMVAATNSWPTVRRAALKPHSALHCLGSETVEQELTEGTEVLRYLCYLPFFAFGCGHGRYTTLVPILVFFCEDSPSVG